MLRRDREMNVVAMLTYRRRIEIVLHPLVEIELVGIIGGVDPTCIEDELIDPERGNLCGGCNLGKQSGSNFLIANIDGTPLVVEAPGSGTHQRTDADHRRQCAQLQDQRLQLCRYF